MNKKELGILRGSFHDIPFVKKGEYHYFIHPLSDGVREVDPVMVEEVTEYIEYLMKQIPDVDLLLTAEAMGIPVTTSLSMRTGIPFSIVRKRSYGLKGEVKAVQKTGYSRSDLYLNLPLEGGKVLLLDDVLSTGGTLRSMIDGLKQTEWEPLAAIVLFNKMGKDKLALEKELGLEIFTLLDIEFVDGKFQADP